MYNTDTELLFPPHTIPSLKGLRDATWDQLVDHVLAEDETSTDSLAFVLMMAKLNGCLTCNSDSFRAMHGCLQCSRQTIRRFNGTDKELVELHKAAKEEVNDFTNK
jgi:hypothetical protein